jgi:hypothetical protein
MFQLPGVLLTETSVIPTYKVGSHAVGPDGKIYKYVKYNSAVGVVAAVAGNACYYYAPSGASAGSFEVTSDLSDSAGLGAGILQAVIASGSHGWIQIKGSATITPALTAGADGNALTAVGATDGTLDVSAAVTDAIVAYAVDASAKIIMCDFPF